MWRHTLLIASSVLWATHSHAEDKAGSVSTGKQSSQAEIGNIIDTETALFGAFHLAPIVVPEGERVGDIIDTGSATLIAGKDDCFPLLAPRQTASQLPAITIQSDQGMAAALGVDLPNGAAVNVGADAGQQHSFVLDFDNVQVQRVSLYQLRTALRKNVPECDIVRPFIDAAYVAPGAGKKPSRLAVSAASGTKLASLAVSDRPPPLLVGMLFTAKRIIHVRVKESLSGGAKLSLGQSLLQKFGIGAKFKVSGDTNSESQVDLVGVDNIPVAFAPAFVVASKKQMASGKTEYSIAAVDSDDIISSIRVARLSEDAKIAEAKKKDFPLWADANLVLKGKVATKGSAPSIMKYNEWVVIPTSQTKELVQSRKPDLSIERVNAIKSVLGLRFDPT